MSMHVATTKSTANPTPLQSQQVSASKAVIERSYWGVSHLHDAVCDKAIAFLDSQGIAFINVHSIAAADLSCTCSRGKHCHAPGKHPQMGSGWHNKKINMHNTWLIDQQKRRNKGNSANLGVKTGYVSKAGKNLVVIDVDDSEHEVLGKLFSTGTFSVCTGSGGYHFYFWSDRGIGNSVSKIYHHIDIRGKNGLVVAPGSFHKSGGRYLPIETSHEYQIVDLPEFISVLLNDMHSKAKTRMRKTFQHSSEVVSNFQDKNKPNAFLKQIDTGRDSKIDRQRKRVNRAASNAELKAYAWMLTCDMKTLIARLLTDEQIHVPRGIRFEVMTRLVGYEVYLLMTNKIKKSEFNKNIVAYRKKFVGYKKDFLASEVQRIVDGIKRRHIMTHNKNKHTVKDRVHGYLAYMSGKNTVENIELQNALKAADNYFFKNCIRENELGIRDKKSFLSIREIVKAHKEWIFKRTGHNIVYSDVSMASKLRELGYYRTRWYNRPVWACQLNTNELENKYKSVEKSNILIKEPVNIRINKVAFATAIVRKDHKQDYIASLYKDLYRTMTIINKNSKTTESILADPPDPNTSVPSTIKIRRKKHPEEPKYPGRPSLEMSTAFSQFLFLLTPQQSAELENETLILDEDGTIEDAKEIRVGDKLGVALRFANGYVPTILEIQDIDIGAEQKETVYNCIDRYTKSEIDFTFQELSIARALGYYDVLFRDGKLHGVEEYNELAVKFAVGDKILDPSNPDDLAALNEHLNKKDEESQETSDASAEQQL
jgi:hypothetical protein